MVLFASCHRRSLLSFWTWRHLQTQHLCSQRCCYNPDPGAWRSQRREATQVQICFSRDDWKSALLVSHPGCEGDAWEVEKEVSANGESWFTRWTSAVGIINPLLKWSGMFCPSGESMCVHSPLPQSDMGSSRVWASEPRSSNTGMSVLPVSENWGGGGGISAGERKECENHNRGILICSSWVNGTGVV